MQTWRKQLFLAACSRYCESMSAACSGRIMVEYANLYMPNACDRLRHAMLLLGRASGNNLTTSAKALLDVEGLTVDFDTGKPTCHRALNGASFSVHEGEVVGLVGESGSGKTVLAHTILGLLPQNASAAGGQVVWLEKNLLHESESELRHVRGAGITMIFQDPQASLNPVFRAGHQIEWVLKRYSGLVGTEAKAEALRLIESVQLSDPERCYRSYPHQLSGGMCQRVMIAMALACRPKLLIADEPTSALDVTTQAEILALLAEINRTQSMALLFISHDVRAVSALCENVVVMYNGSVVEAGAVASVFELPKHEYTQRLLKAAACRMDSVRTSFGLSKAVCV